MGTESAELSFMQVAVERSEPSFVASLIPIVVLVVVVYVIVRVVRRGRGKL